MITLYSDFIVCQEAKACISARSLNLPSWLCYHDNLTNLLDHTTAHLCVCIPKIGKVGISDSDIRKLKTGYNAGAGDGLAFGYCVGISHGGLRFLYDYSIAHFTQESIGFRDSHETLTLRSNYK
jgi:hypothetical protein